MEQCEACPKKVGDVELCKSIILEGFCDLYSENRPLPQLQGVLVHFETKPKKSANVSETLRNGEKVRIETLEVNKQYL